MTYQKLSNCAYCTKFTTKEKIMNDTDTITNILKLEKTLGIDWNNISPKFSKRPKLLEDIKINNNNADAHCGASTSSTLTMEFFVAIADNSWMKPSAA